MIDIGRMLIIFGSILFIIGLLFTFSNRFLNIGKLPGDILIQKENFTFYFPVVTSIIISIVLTLIFWIFRR